MSARIKIALVDDERLIVEGIKLLLSSEKSINVCLSANDGNEFLEYLNQTHKQEFPDIALIDIQMYPINGFELVEILRKEYPKLKIIVLSSHYKSNVLGYMVKLGISAFLSKSSDKNTFIEVIHNVYENGIYLSEEDHKMLIAYMNNHSQKKSLFGWNEELSEREKEVVRLICKQYTNYEIADKLFLSPRTVESHRQRIIEKVGAKNTVGLVIYAIVNDIFMPALKT